MTDLWTVHRVPIPGIYRNAGLAYLDLETVKVPAGSPGSEGYRMKNGQLLRMRWSAFIYGVAVGQHVLVVERMMAHEDEFLGSLETALGDATVVVYGATRQFDEMILKGRFTNARRAHADQPFYPALPGADKLDWVNVGPAHGLFPRSFTDVPSPGIWREWMNGNRTGVLVHNLRDVVELILMAGDPDPECRGWCTAVMRNDEFAERQLWPVS